MLGKLLRDKNGKDIQGFETKKVIQSGVLAVDFTSYMAISPQTDVDVTVTTADGVQPVFTIKAGSIRVCTGWESVTFGTDTLIELM